MYHVCAVHKLTAVVTLLLNCWNSAEFWSASSCVKFCCILNPRLIFGSDWAAGVVDAPFADGEVVVPGNRIDIKW